MSEQLRTRRALWLIHKHQPKTLSEITQLGFTCVYVGEGAFRTAYRIRGTSLLIKFPSSDAACDFWHTRSEVRKIRALRQFKSLRRHLPPVYYFNSKHGVMVTKYYPRAAEWRLKAELNGVLSDVIKELTGIVLEDISPDNLKLNRDRDLIFIDLGY